MREIKGEFNTAKVFTDAIEDESIKQIKTLCDMEFSKDSKIRIMPDVHAGAGCTIGTTMTIKDKAVPNLVGVDIGCGMETAKLKTKHIEVQKLDKIVYDKIPSGFKTREKEHRYADMIDLSLLKCKDRVNVSKGYKSIGTLGGGNHFIEADKDEEGNLYIVIHSGSRHIGLEVANYYQREAYKRLSEEYKASAEEYIESLKEIPVPQHLAYVHGELFDDYIHDMKIIQEFAELNRKAMMHEIVKNMKLTPEEQFTTIHNYIDMEMMILRKGAVSAKEGEKILIPINMRDGSLICTGKGNQDWNYSAPHGAGRLMSRSQAKESFTVSEFKKQMKDVYTTSVSKDTLDECPMAYKNMEDIIQNITPTADIINIIKPIYNFKAKD